MLLFLFYSYVKSQFDNDSRIPMYKTILAICDTPRHTQCVQNHIFLHIAMVIVDCGLELWFVFCSKLRIYFRNHLGILHT